MSETENKSGGGLNPATVKWIVIGVVIIVGLFVLKGPLGKLIDRTDELSITGGGVTLKTAKTAIGDLKVSSEKVNVQEAQQIASTVSANDKTVVENNFMLSWPKETWMRDDSMLPQLQEFYNQMGLQSDIILYCRQREMSAEGFHNNIFVATSSYDNSLSWEQQMEQVKTGINMMGQGTQFLTYEVDAETKGATIIYTTSISGYEMYQIQRYGYKDGKLIQIVASTLVQDKEAQAQINEIVNSFRIVEG